VDLGLVVGEETEGARVDLNLSLSFAACLLPILCLVGVD
jgi:hypothetical protein